MINPKELLLSVDEENHPIEPQPRDISHKTGIWHRSCHIWIVNARQEILCQQRSLLKDSNPGLWEPFFGGHLAPGQEYIDAACVEVGEELGLIVDREQLHFFKEYKFEPGTEFQGIFTLHWDGESSTLQLEEEEVERVTWRTIEDIRRNVIDERSSKWVYIGYEEEILATIESDKGN
jgi:isopentenyldiphosphate isomerase